MSTELRPPSWVPLAIALVRHLPFARYRVLHRLRRHIARPFLAHLSKRAGGLQFLCDPRDTVASEACFTGMYEPQETQLLLQTLRAGDVFVDVGANWGYFSLIAGRAVGAGGRVVALEPEPRLFALLSSNVELNGLTCVAARQTAASGGTGRVGFAAFDANSDNWGTSHTLVDSSGADFYSATLALDDLLDGEQIRDVDLVKIDVEGGEVDVLDGMRRGLRDGRYHRVLLEIHPTLLEPRGQTPTVCLDRLRDAGYRLFAVEHSPVMHRRAARRTVALSDLIHPLGSVDDLGVWPHVFATAPGVSTLP